MKNKQIIKIAKIAGLLKTIKRQGWVLRGIKNAESVADHAFRVVFLAVILSKNKNLDRDKVIKMALIHDIGKSVVGDVVYESGRNVNARFIAKQKDEKRAVYKIFENIADRKEYLALWNEKNEERTKEAKFVKLIEKVELIIQALEYEEQGYEKRLFNEFWENAEKYLKGSKLEDLFEDLKKERKKIKKA